MDYEEMKSKHPDAVLLIRNNDVYECYDDDARYMHENFKLSVFKEEERSVCAFKSRELDIYLPKLIRFGRKVAIFD
jgi:DNA mismatch repair ATPase MutS